jgi:hypothetical protein
MSDEQGPQGIQGVQGIQGIHGDHGTYVSQVMCNELHRQSNEKYDALFALTTEINKRLFKDNGTVSIQTRLDRGDRILGVLCWAMTIAGGALIIALLTLAWKTIAKVWLT